jgi:potassium efflux system protein
MFPKTHEFLQYPLITLSGGTITPGSVLTAAAVLAVAVVVANLVGRWLRQWLAARGLAVGTQFAIAKIARYSLITLGAFVAVSSIGLKLDAFIATSAVLAVGIGFGLQNVAQNFVSGLVLLLERPVSKGDFVKVGDAVGVIDDIGLRATQIITRDEVTIIVPNSELIASKVINHSKPTTNLRIHVTVGVAYGSDLQLVRRELLAVAAAHDEVLTDPPAEVRLESFGESWLELLLLVWIAHPKDDLRIASDLRFAIERAFSEKGIEIPLPQVVEWKGEARPRPN